MSIYFIFAYLSSVFYVLDRLTNSIEKRDGIEDTITYGEGIMIFRAHTYSI